MIKRLAHVCFRTDFFSEMTVFYRDLLGLPIKFSLTLPTGEVFGHYFSLGENSFLELFDEAGATAMWGGASTPRRVPPADTYQHFCLQVEGLKSLREELVSKGLAVTELAVGMDHSCQCWIKDPDGNDIELMEYTEASLQTR